MLRRGRRRSALLRLAFGYAAFFTCSVGILFLVLHVTIEDFMHRQARSAVAEEIARINDKNDLGLREVETYIRDRTRDLATLPSNRLIYLYVDADLRCPATTSGRLANCPIGNLLQWPDVARSESRWRQFDVVLSNGENAFAMIKILPLRHDYRVLVGQNLSPQQRMTDELGRLLIIGAVLTLAIGGAGGWFVARRIVRRIERINLLCHEVGPQGLGGRLPETGPNDEFGELSQNINGMLDRISELMSLTRSTTDQIAHDLRTPLARLRIKLESLIERLPDSENVAVAESAIDDIEAILNTFAALLEIAKNESGDTSTFERIDLRATIEQVLELYRPVAEESGLQLKTEIETVWIDGNEGVLKQMLANLIDNAIKFSPPDGRIGIALASQDGRFELSISDNGPGIPENQRAKIFERFYRSADSDGVAGHGLGLSLVRAIARRHDIQIDLLDNNPGLKVVLMGKAYT
ncbi:MAG: HAMP domain-containing sensor histidine kinase [Pseudomonadota bacterium]